MVTQRPGSVVTGIDRVARCPQATVGGSVGFGGHRLKAWRRGAGRAGPEGPRLPGPQFPVGLGSNRGLWTEKPRTNTGRLIGRFCLASVVHADASTRADD